MKLSFSVTIDIDINSANLKDIIEGFKKELRPCFQQVVIKALRYFAAKYMGDGTLRRMLGSSKLTWKTSKGNEMTSIQTIFGKIQVPQLQVKDHDRGTRVYISRLILGIKPRVRIPQITVKMIGLMGSLASYRVVRKITGIFSGG